MNILLCLQCRAIIFDGSKVILTQDNDIFLKFLPQTVIFKPETEPLFKNTGFDAYCFFYELFCNECFFKLGKKYLTFNNNLIHNEIQVSLDKSFILMKELDFSYFCEKKLSDSKTSKISENAEKSENNFIKALDVKEDIFGLPGFINSARALQAMRMKKFLRRILFLEEIIEKILFPKIIELLNQ